MALGRALNAFVSLPGRIVECILCVQSVVYI